MIYGTAGFTAAQCVTAIVERGIDGRNADRWSLLARPAAWVRLSVAILAKLGYHVEAVTGKAEHHDWLKRKLGAKTDSQP